jgi:PAS domain S-box-containing protein
MSLQQTRAGTVREGRMMTEGVMTRVVLETVFDKIFLVTMEGDVLYATPSASHLLDLEVSALVGRNVRVFIHPDDRDLFDVALRASGNTGSGESNTVDVRCVRPDGTCLPVELLASQQPSPSDTQQFIALVFRDTRHRRHVEEERSKGAEHEKLELVRRLTSRLSHEIKNPLTVILMGVEYLTRRNRTSTDPEMSAVLDDMEGAVRRANAIVRGLLEMSVSEDLVFGPESVNSLVEETLGRLGPRLADQRVRVLRELAKGLPTVDADRRHLGQVLNRVIENAMSRMKNGGDLLVRTFQRNGVGESMIEAVIEDSGPPLSETDLARVFDPAWLARAENLEGGLGLPLVREIIRMHGGEVLVANREGDSGFRVVISVRVG